MSKFMMGFQILFMLVFFIAVKVEANPMERCIAMIDFEDQMDDLMQLSSEEQLTEVCPNLTSMLNCMNNVLKQETGFSLRELADLLRGTEIGNVMALVVNLEDLVVDMCTEGSEFREEYRTHFECYDSLDKDTLKQCKDQAEAVYETYKELQAETGRRSQGSDEPCVMVPYQLACYGSTVHEACGDDAFDFYKKIVKKLGFLKSGICSENVVQTIKTSLLDSLDISQSHKSLYRVILDLKKRRK